MKKDQIKRLMTNLADTIAYLSWLQPKQAPDSEVSKTAASLRQQLLDTLNSVVSTEELNEFMKTAQKDMQVMLDHAKRK
ncbi:MAG: hypothetical protein MJZ34_02575 [Paludibacteraceae bacterium]|nr:hypothetical protein [Paludibacteraceae bacterium]